MTLIYHTKLTETEHWQGKDGPLVSLGTIGMLYHRRPTHREPKGLDQRCGLSVSEDWGSLSASLGEP